MINTSFYAEGRTPRSYTLIITLISSVDIINSGENGTD